MLTTTERLDQCRRQADTPYGPASCIDTGGAGRAALFVHGLLTSSYLWRNVIGQLDEQRRCAWLSTFRSTARLLASPARTSRCPAWLASLPVAATPSGLPRSTWSPTTAAGPLPRCLPPATPTDCTPSR